MKLASVQTVSAVSTDDYLSKCNINGKKGIIGTYWNNRQQKGDAIATEQYTEPINLTTAGQHQFAKGVLLKGFSAIYNTRYNPKTTEDLTINISFTGNYILKIKGETILLINGYQIDKENHIWIGNDEDICSECLQELADKKNITYTAARHELKGQLTKQPIYKILLHGSYHILCVDHINKIVESIQGYLNSLQPEIPEEAIDEIKEDTPVPEEHQVKKRSKSKNETKNDA
jgi:hypothetical protein